MSTTSELWRGDVASGRRRLERAVVRWSSAASASEPLGPPDPGPRARMPTRVGGAQDPARPADRPGAQPQGAGRQAGQQERAGRAGHRAARPVRGGRADRRRGVRPALGRRSAPAKGLAPRALAQELRRKGVDDEVAREALDEIEPGDEEAAARVLVRKKLRVHVPARRHRRPPAGWSGCWPARATRRAWRSRSSATSWRPLGDNARVSDPVVHVVVHDGDRQHSGVAHAGESWAAAARRTVASMHVDPVPRTSPGRSSTSRSTTTPGWCFGR